MQHMLMALRVESINKTVGSDAADVYSDWQLHIITTSICILRQFDFNLLVLFNLFFLYVKHIVSFKRQYRHRQSRLSTWHGTNVLALGQWLKITASFMQ